MAIETHVQKEAYVLREPRRQEEVKYQEAPLPLGTQAQPWIAEFCQELLHEHKEWTNDAALFLTQTLTGTRGETYSTIRSSAEREYLRNNPDSTFPLVEFSDFMQKAFRFGLLEMTYESPDGNVFSRERRVLYSLSHEGYTLVTESAHEVTSLSVISSDGTDFREAMLDAAALKELIPILKAAEASGPVETETLLDRLTEKIPDRDLDAAYDTFDTLVRTCLREGFLAATEDSLGGSILSVTDAGAALTAHE